MSIPQTTAADINNLIANVSSLQKDMAQVGTLVDRLDITIEKLTEVSTTVSQLLAVQGNRLEYQEKVADQLQGLVEQRRQESEASFRDMGKKLEKVETDLFEELDSNHEKILAEIKSLKKDSAEQHIAMGERMTRLEKWMWILMGGGAILVFVIDKINIAGLFH
jgi:DNA repair exonuclease SbcCD ATPase subunit